MRHKKRSLITIDHKFWYGFLAFLAVTGAALASTTITDSYIQTGNFTVNSTGLFVNNTVIQMAGNVGIGTTSPQNALNVIGDINATGAIYSTAPRFKVGTFTRDTSTASGIQAITGVGFKPSLVMFFAYVDQTSKASWGSDDGVLAAGQVPMVMQPGGTFLNTGQVYSIIIVSTWATAWYGGKIQSMDSDGFTISWTKTGSPTGIALIQYTAFR